MNVVAFPDVLRDSRPAPTILSARYYPEVDAMRAIAILPVVFFHAGFAAFSGGYVGVDVFFVISGFLITGSIKAEIEARTFSIGRFYERRVRRIIPALVLMILASLAAGCLLLLPYQLKDLAKSAVSAILFGSNVWFWRETGYFAAAQGLQPLLHTWSLGIEEQFYVAFPLLLAALSAMKVSSRTVLAAIFLASLTLAELLVHLMPAASFFLLPTRAWELVLGALVALEPSRTVSARRGTVIGLLGLALILAPVFGYPTDIAFPGFSALPPCLGAALMLLVIKAGGAPALQWLKVPALVGVGLISYSLYLWHWPIFAFTRQFAVNTELSLTATWLGVAGSVAAGWVSWKFVETPFRDRARMTAHQLMVFCGLSTILALGVAVALWGGWPSRFNAVELTVLQGKQDVPAQMRNCLGSTADGAFCRLGTSGAPTFAVWGDSHSAAIGEAIDIVARKAEQAGVLFAFNGCPPARNAPAPTLDPPDQADCRTRNEIVSSEISENTKISTVILVANWDSYLSRSHDAMLNALEIEAAHLRRAGKQVIVLGNLPDPGFDVPWAVAASLHFGRTPPGHMRLFDDSAALISLGRYIPLYPPFCENRECRVMARGVPMFVDANHVSSSANRLLLAPYLEGQNLFVPVQPPGAADGAAHRPAK